MIKKIKKVSFSDRAKKDELDEVTLHKVPLKTAEILLRNYYNDDEQRSTGGGSVASALIKHLSGQTDFVVKSGKIVRLISV